MFCQSSIPSACATTFALWGSPMPCKAPPVMSQVKPSRQGSAGLAGKAASPHIHTAHPSVGTGLLSPSAGHRAHPASPEQPSPTSQHRDTTSPRFLSHIVLQKVVLVIDRHSVVPLNLSSQAQATSSTTRAYQDLRGRKIVLLTGLKPKIPG